MIEIELDITCAGCGDSLDAKISNDTYYDGRISVSVEPCTTCLNAARDDAEAEGRREGYSEGYDDGHAEGFAEASEE